MSFAGRQPSRQRGSDGDCRRSATEQQREVVVPCKMNFVVGFYVLNSRLLFHRGCVREGHANMSFAGRQPSRRRCCVPHHRLHSVQRQANHRVL